MRATAIETILLYLDDRIWNYAYDKWDAGNCWCIGIKVSFQHKRFCLWLVVVLI